MGKGAVLHDNALAFGPGESDRVSVECLRALSMFGTLHPQPPPAPSRLWLSITSLFDGTLNLSFLRAMRLMRVFAVFHFERYAVVSCH